MGNGMQVSGANLWNMTPQTLMFGQTTMPLMNSTFGDGFMPLDPNEFMFQCFKFGMPSLTGGRFMGFGGGNGWWGGMRQWFAAPMAMLGGGGGWTPTLSTPSLSSSTSSSVTAKTPEQRKYENMYNLLKKYADSRAALGDTVSKNKINEINSSSASYEDKYNRLKTEVYDVIGADKISAYALADTGDGLTVGNTSMGLIIASIGGRDNDNYKSNGANIVAGTEAVDTNTPILSLLSSYNSADRNLIADLCAKGLTDSNVMNRIMALKNMLVAEAEAQSRNLDPENKYYSKLKAMVVVKESNKTDFIKEFNKVYAYTRIIAAKVAGNMLHEDYPIFNADILTARIETDLKTEKGIKDFTFVTDAKALKIKEDAYIGTRAFDIASGVGEMEATAALGRLASREVGQLSKTTVGTTTVYVENYGANKKKYIVEDGKIYEATVSGTTVTKGAEVASAQVIQERMIEARNGANNQEAINADKQSIHLRSGDNFERNQLLDQAETIIATIANATPKPTIQTNDEGTKYVVLDGVGTVFINAEDNGTMWIDIKPEGASESMFRYYLDQNGSMVAHYETDQSNNKYDESTPITKRHYNEAFLAVIEKIFGEDAVADQKTKCASAQQERDRKKLTLNLTGTNAAEIQTQTDAAATVLAKAANLSAADKAKATSGTKVGGEYQWVNLYIGDQWVNIRKYKDHVDISISTNKPANGTDYSEVKYVITNDKITASVSDNNVSTFNLCSKIEVNSFTKEDLITILEEIFGDKISGWFEFPSSTPAAS